MDNLGRALNKIRSKGGIMVLTGQDERGFADAYGDKRGPEILGQCRIKLILALGSPETAEWVARTVGKERINKRTRNPTGESETEALDEPALAAEFMQLTPPDPETGIQGLFLSPHVGKFWFTIAGDDVAEQINSTARLQMIHLCRRFLCDLVACSLRRWW